MEMEWVRHGSSGYAALTRATTPGARGGSVREVSDFISIYLRQAKRRKAGFGEQIGFAKHGLPGPRAELGGGADVAAAGAPGRRWRPVLASAMMAVLAARHVVAGPGRQCTADPAITWVAVSSSTSGR